MKYAIVVDSSCALTKKQAEALGWFYTPLHINVDDKEFEDGVDINTSNLFNYYTKKAKVKTSVINLAKTSELFEKLSKEYDKIIFYPISHHLSSTYQTSKTMEEEFPKLRAIKSIEIVQLIVLDLIWFEQQMAKDPSKFEEYIKFIEDGSFHKSITLIPKYNDYLVKGGRLHPAAAAIAKLFKIVPLISVDRGELKKEGVGRVFAKSTIKNIASKAKDFKLENKDNELISAYVHTGASQEEQEKYIEEFRIQYKQEPFVGWLAPVVAIHTGPEAFANVAVECPKETKELFLNKMEQIKDLL
ncbi:DegV family protein [Mycoplasmopsis caviae]|uniref:DegV family protein n=1 Tax=Mycoplasmopsis caviae TaxID=55603 RepID=A0A3P8MF86_9BACT|nr:DegV family protein [Mycoplasmopsis caviae]UUD35262.1 DegV family protein [Mycoplasmopsis caviae]VDR41953.1 Fatty acid-binding protein DegV-like protein [Mycoplasmopsis caviae]